MPANQSFDPPPPGHPGRRYWNWLADWAELGMNRDDLDIHDRRAQYVTNIGPLGLAKFVIFYNILFISTGNPTLIWTGLVQLPIAALGMVWFRACQKSNKPASYWSLQILLSVDVWAAMLAGQGTLINGHAYFLMFTVLTTLIVPVRRWRHAALLSATNLGQFLILNHLKIPAAPEIQQIPSDMITILGIVMYISMTVSVVAIAYISELFTSIIEGRLSTLAYTDVLTDLPNRRAFQEALNRATAKAARDCGALSVAVIDIDKFKHINDIYGHNSGDATLRHVADLLREYARQSDFVARFGGEEFVILMGDTPLESALGAAERIRHAIENTPCSLTKNQVRVSVSIGIAQWQIAMQDLNLVEAADKALYKAKNTGRNRVCAFAQEQAEAFA